MVKMFFSGFVRGSFLVWLSNFIIILTYVLGYYVSLEKHKENGIFQKYNFSILYI